jgi:hypothetical protein
MKSNKTPEFKKFDEMMGEILSVSRDELEKREAQYQKTKQEGKKKRVKKPPASRASVDND